MEKEKVVPLLKNVFPLNQERFLVLKEESEQLLLYDEINQIYFDIKPTNQVSNFVTSDLFGFHIELTYEKTNGLSRQIEMLDTGKILLDEIRLVEGEYTATFTSSEKLVSFELGEEELLEKVVFTGSNEITRVGNYYLVTIPNQTYFDISLRKGEAEIYTEHHAKKLDQALECNRIRIAQGKNNRNHIDTTTATEGTCKIYRMTYMGEDEPNYSSYFISSVSDDLNRFSEWAPYQFSSIDNPYQILLRDAETKKEEIISYLTFMKWNPDHLRLTILKMKDEFEIFILGSGTYHCTKLPVLHSNLIDSDELKILWEYLETVITDSSFLEILSQELIHFSDILRQESKEDVLDTFSTESLFNQGMEETKRMICSNQNSVIEQLLKKRNSFELNISKEKIKEYKDEIQGGKR